MRSVTLLAALAAAAPAHAATVVLVPLIPDGVDSKAVAGIHQLLSSELEFASGVDGVEDVAERPAELTLKCLVATTCLKTIAREGGGDWLITGVLHNRGATSYGLELLLFDNTSSRIVRRKEWSVPTDSTALANGMTDVVKELITGEGSGDSTEAAVAATDFSSGDDDEVVLGAGPSAAEIAAAEAARQAAAAAAARNAAAESARQAAAAEAARQAAAEAARQAAAEAARQAAAAEAARRAAAAEAARQAAAAEAARQAALATAAAPPADVDEADIQFGGSASDITAEDIDAIQFGAPPPIASSPAPVAPAPVADLDEDRPAPRPAPRRAPPTATVEARPKPGGAEPEAYGPDILSVAIRGGYANYYTFHFVTAGGELAVPITSGLAALVGLDTYAVQRQLPPDLAASTGLISEWNTIFPVNVGLGYTVGTGRVQPRFGADLIAANYYRDEVGSDWAVGGRARGDLDLYVTKNFGIQVHTAFGLWQGRNFPLIEQGVAASGFLPQVGAGTVLAL